MKAVKISCVMVALMFISLGCVSAICPSDAENTSETTPMLSELTHEASFEIEQSEYYIMTVPEFDVATAMYSTTDFNEIRVYADSFPQLTSTTPGGVNKTEKFVYYAHVVMAPPTPSTQHYDGYYVYIDNLTLSSVLTVGTGALGFMLGGPLGSAAATVVATAVGLLGNAAASQYPDGIIVVLATGIYLTRTITIPTLTVLEIWSQ